MTIGDILILVAIGVVVYLLWNKDQGGGTPRDRGGNGDSQDMPR